MRVDSDSDGRCGSSYRPRQDREQPVGSVWATSKSDEGTAVRAASVPRRANTKIDHRFWKTYGLFNSFAKGLLRKPSSLPGRAPPLCAGRWF